MISIKKYIITISIFALAAIIVYAYIALKSTSKHNSSAVNKSTPKQISKIISTADCPITAEEYEVRGASMSPLVEAGETVTVYKGYEQCNQFKKGDLLIYKFNGYDTPLLKAVRGASGDKFALIQNEQGTWNIIINDEVAKNSQGQAYELSEGTHKMLANYAIDYPVIPADTYLILGEEIGGSIDSTKFGLVGKSGIVGLAELK